MAFTGSGKSMKPVSIVIPVLNEAATMPELLQALETLSAKPAELVFVDAGCTDNSISLVNDWWKTQTWPGASLKVASAPGAYPGAARNAGITCSSQPWVAFLDAGIAPDSDWLEALFAHAGDAQIVGVFGMTRFTGRGALTTALCALSYGQDAERQTLPSSMFRRTVFDHAGLFAPALRAGEDILWMNRLRQQYPGRTVVARATTLYFHFPPSLSAAVAKWYGYERHVARAGLNNRVAAVYLAALAGLCAAFLLNTAAGLALCAAYLFLRGVIDPVRRSRHWYWWHRSPPGFFLAPVCAALIDGAKFAGRLRGCLERARS